ncbi:hypothetical protein [Streptomyces sp. AN091965]|uniref:hypothetical protein n=1 Tax=Streptomyces sp. AN091965 TaxID=2927803 RepID=UPI001F60FB7C|nr:hypothetical protein [Streptomyces sp. AN091965]MCI3928808.1 hypothetical protein [Streptomyces sp. AN091965]
MSELLAGIGGLVAGVVAAGALVQTWSSSPRFRKPELHTVEVTHSNWAVPSLPVDFSGAPSIDAGIDAVDEWLFAQGGAPVSWYIRTVLFVGNAHSLIITGVRPEARCNEGLLMRSSVITQLGGNGYLRRRAYITTTAGGPTVKLFDDENHELASLGLNLNKGDALEFTFCIEGAAPGAMHQVSLTLNLLVNGRAKSLPVADGRTFKIATALPGGEPSTYPGANLMY